MARVTLTDLNKIYPARDRSVHAVKDLNLTVEDGEYVALLGPSGCGKTSTLRMIVGLEGITSGTIAFDGKHVNELTPEQRNVAMAFETYALYPNFTVAENLAFPLEVRGLGKAERGREVARIAKLLRIESILEQKPAQLSGGQQQRVSLGRALIRDPAAFILDEVMSHLDAHLKFKMLFELKRIHRSLGKTTIYVTHDQVEALALADRIAVMSNAVLQQYGTRDDLYHRPVNRFVADFIGEPPTNFFAGEIAEDQEGVSIAGGWLRPRLPAGCITNRCLATTGGAAGHHRHPTAELLDDRLAGPADSVGARGPQRISRRAIDRHAGSRRHDLSGSCFAGSRAFARRADILVLSQQRCHGFRSGVRDVHRLGSKPHEP